MTQDYEYPPRRLYRSRHALIFGVCAGTAEYLNLSVFWTRMLVLIGFIFTGFFPIAAIYLLAALLMKRAPYGTYRYEDRAFHRASRRCGSGDGLNGRIRRMEKDVLDRSRSWEERLYNS